MATSGGGKPKQVVLIANKSLTSNSAQFKETYLDSDGQVEVLLDPAEGRRVGFASKGGYSGLFRGEYVRMDPKKLFEHAFFQSVVENASDIIARDKSNKVEIEIDDVEVEKLGEEAPDLTFARSEKERDVITGDEHNVIVPLATKDSNIRFSYTIKNQSGVFRTKNFVHKNMVTSAARAASRAERVASIRKELVAESDPKPKDVLDSVQRVFKKPALVDQALRELSATTDGDLQRAIVRSQADLVVSRKAAKEKAESDRMRAVQVKARELAKQSYIATLGADPADVNALDIAPFLQEADKEVPAIPEEQSEPLAVAGDEVTDLTVHRVVLKEIAKAGESFKWTFVSVCSWLASTALISFFLAPFVAFYRWAVVSSEVHDIAASIRPVAQKRHADKKAMLAQVNFLSKFFAGEADRLEPKVEMPDDPLEEAPEPTPLRAMSYNLEDGYELGRLIDDAQSHGLQTSGGKYENRVYEKLIQFYRDPHKSDIIIPIGLEEGREYNNHFLIISFKNGRCTLKHIREESSTATHGKNSMVTEYDAPELAVGYEDVRDPKTGEKTRVIDKELKNFIDSLIALQSMPREAPGTGGPSFVNRTLDNLLTTSFGHPLEKREIHAPSTDLAKLLFVVTRELVGTNPASERLQDIASSKARFFECYVNHMISFIKENESSLYTSELVHALKGLASYVGQLEHYLEKEIGHSSAHLVCGPLRQFLTEKLAVATNLEVQESGDIAMLNAKPITFTATLTVSPKEVLQLQAAERRAATGIYLSPKAAVGALELRRLFKENQDAIRAHLGAVHDVDRARAVQESADATRAQLDKLLKRVDKLLIAGKTQEAFTFAASILQEIPPPVAYAQGQRSIWEMLDIDRLLPWQKTLSVLSEKMGISALRAGKTPPAETAFYFRVLLPLVMRQLYSRTLELQRESNQLLDHFSNRPVTAEMRAELLEAQTEHIESVKAEIEKEVTAEHKTNWADEDEKYERELTDYNTEAGSYDQRKKLYERYLRKKAAYEKSVSDNMAWRATAPKDRWGIILEAARAHEPKILEIPDRVEEPVWPKVPTPPMTEEERKLQLEQAIQEKIRESALIQQLQALDPCTVGIEMFGQMMSRPDTDLRMWMAVGRYARLIGLEPAKIAYAYFSQNGGDIATMWGPKENPAAPGAVGGAPAAPEIVPERLLLMTDDFSWMLGDNPELDKSYVACRNFARAYVDRIAEQRRDQGRFAVDQNRQNSATSQIAALVGGYNWLNPESDDDNEKFTLQLLGRTLSEVNMAMSGFMADGAHAASVMVPEELGLVRKHDSLAAIVEHMETALTTYSIYDAWGFTRPDSVDVEAAKRSFKEAKSLYFVFDYQGRNLVKAARKSGTPIMGTYVLSTTNTPRSASGDYAAVAGSAGLGILAGKGVKPFSFFEMFRPGKTDRRANELGSISPQTLESPIVATREAEQAYANATLSTIPDHGEQNTGPRLLLREMALQSNVPGSEHPFSSTSVPQCFHFIHQAIALQPEMLTSEAVQHHILDVIKQRTLMRQALVENSGFFVHLTGVLKRHIAFLGAKSGNYDQFIPFLLSISTRLKLYAAEYLRQLQANEVRVPQGLVGAEVQRDLTRIVAEMPSYDNRKDGIHGIYSTKRDHANNKLYALYFLDHVAAKSDRGEDPLAAELSVEEQARPEAERAAIIKARVPGLMKDIIEAFSILQRSPVDKGHWGMQVKVRQSVFARVMPLVVKRLMEFSPEERALFLNNIAFGRDDGDGIWVPDDSSRSGCFMLTKTKKDEEGQEIDGSEEVVHRVNFCTGEGLYFDVSRPQRGELPLAVLRDPQYIKLFGFQKSNEGPVVDQIPEDPANPEGNKIYQWEVDSILYQALHKKDENIVRIYQVSRGQRYQFFPIEIDKKGVMALLGYRQCQIVEHLIESKGTWVKVDAQGKATEKRRAYIAQRKTLEEDRITLHFAGKRLSGASMGEGRARKWICSSLKGEDQTLFHCQGLSNLLLLSSNGTKVDEIRVIEPIRHLVAVASDEAAAPARMGVAEGQVASGKTEERVDRYETRFILVRHKGRWVLEGKPEWELHFADTLEVENAFGKNWREFVLPLKNSKTGERQYWIYPYFAHGNRKSGAEEIMFVKKPAHIVDMVRELATSDNIEELLMKANAVKAKVEKAKEAVDGKAAAGDADAAAEADKPKDGPGEEEELIQRKAMDLGLLRAALEIGQGIIPNQQYEEMIRLFSGMMRKFGINTDLESLVMPTPICYTVGSTPKSTHAGFLYLAFNAYVRGDFASASNFLDKMVEQGHSGREVDFNQLRTISLMFFANFLTGNGSLGMLQPETHRKKAFYIKLLVALDKVKTQTAGKFMMLDAVKDLIVTIVKRMIQARANDRGAQDLMRAIDQQGPDAIHTLLMIFFAPMAASYKDLVKEARKDLAEHGLLLSKEEESRLAKQFPVDLAALLKVPVITDNIPPPALSFLKSLLGIKEREVSAPISFEVPTDREVNQFLKVHVTVNSRERMDRPKMHKLLGERLTSKNIVAHFWDYVRWIVEKTPTESELSFLFQKIPGDEPKPKATDIARRLLLTVYHIKVAGDKVDGDKRGNKELQFGQRYEDALHGILRASGQLPDFDAIDRTYESIKADLVDAPGLVKVLNGICYLGYKYTARLDGLKDRERNVGGVAQQKRGAVDNLQTSARALFLGTSGASDKGLLATFRELHENVVITQSGVVERAHFRELEKEARDRAAGIPVPLKGYDAIPEDVLRAIAAGNEDEGDDSDADRPAGLGLPVPGAAGAPAAPAAAPAAPPARDPKEVAWEHFRSHLVGSMRDTLNSYGMAAHIPAVTPLIDTLRPLAMVAFDRGDGRGVRQHLVDNFDGHLASLQGNPAHAGIARLLSGGFARNFAVSRLGSAADSAYQALVQARASRPAAAPAAASVAAGAAGPSRGPKDIAWEHFRSNFVGSMTRAFNRFNIAGITAEQISSIGPMVDTLLQPIAMAAFDFDDAGAAQRHLVDGFNGGLSLWLRDSRHAAAAALLERQRNYAEGEMTNAMDSAYAELLRARASRSAPAPAAASGAAGPGPGPAAASVPAAAPGPAPAAAPAAAGAAAAQPQAAPASRPVAASARQFEDSREIAWKEFKSYLGGMIKLAMAGKSEEHINGILRIIEILQPIAMASFNKGSEQEAFEHFAEGFEGIFSFADLGYAMVKPNGNDKPSAILKGLVASLKRDPKGFRDKYTLAAAQRAAAAPQPAGAKEIDHLVQPEFMGCFLNLMRGAMNRAFRKLLQAQARDRKKPEPFQIEIGYRQISRETERFYFCKARDRSELWQSRLGTINRYLTSGNGSAMEKTLFKNVRKGSEKALKAVQNRYNRSLKVTRLKLLREKISTHLGKLKQESSDMRARLLDFAKTYRYQIRLGNPRLTDMQILNHVVDLYRYDLLGTVGNTPLQKEFEQIITHFLLAETERQQYEKADEAAQRLWNRLGSIVSHVRGGSEEARAKKIQELADDDIDWLIGSGDILYAMREGGNRVRYASKVGDHYVLGSSKESRPIRGVEYVPTRAVAKAFLVEDYRKAQITRLKQKEAFEAIQRGERFVKVRMGIGKSTFLFPHLTQKALADGKKPVLMTTSKLVDQLKTFLGDREYCLFKFDMEWGEGLQHGDGDNFEVNNAILKSIKGRRETLYALHKEGRYVLSTPDWISAVLNMHGKLSDEREKLEPEDTEKRRFIDGALYELDLIIQYFRDPNAVFYLDEDVNCDISFEYNFAIGNPAPPERPLFDMADKFVRTLLSNEDHRRLFFSDELRSIQDPQVKESVGYEMLRDTVERLYDDNAFWESPKVGGRLWRGMVSKELFVEFMLGEGDMKEFPTFGGGSEEDIKNARQFVARLKQLVIETFNSIYDTHPTQARGIDVRNGMGVVPYLDGIPKWCTQYGEPAEVVLHALFHYAFSPLDPAKRRYESFISERIFRKKHKELQGLRNPISDFSEKTWNEWSRKIADVCRDRPECGGDIFKAFCHPDCWQERLDLLRNLTYNEGGGGAIATFPEQIVTNSQAVTFAVDSLSKLIYQLSHRESGGQAVHRVALGGSAKVLSGTGDVVAMNQASPDDDDSSALDDISGETLLSLWGLAEKSFGLDTVLKEEEDIFDSTLDHIKKRAQERDPETGEYLCRAIINTGFDVSQNRSETLAAELRDHLKQQELSRQMVFVSSGQGTDGERQRQVWNAGDQSVRVAYNPDDQTQVNKGNSLFYYGPADKRGIDFRIPRGQKVYGDIMVDVNLDLDDFCQAAFRMRELGFGQMGRISIDKKMAKKVREENGLGEDEPITVGHVIRTIIKKTVKNQEIRHIKAAVFAAKAPLMAAVERELSTPLKMEEIRTHEQVEEMVGRFKSMLFAVHRELKILRNVFDADRYLKRQEDVDSMTFMQRLYEGEMAKVEKMRAMLEERWQAFMAAHHLDYRFAFEDDLEDAEEEVAAPFNIGYMSAQEAGQELDRLQRMLSGVNQGVTNIDYLRRQETNGFLENRLERELERLAAVTPELERRCAACRAKAPPAAPAAAAAAAAAAPASGGGSFLGALAAAVVNSVAGAADSIANTLQQMGAAAEVLYNQSQPPKLIWDWDSDAARAAARAAGLPPPEAPEFRLEGAMESALLQMQEKFDNFQKTYGAIMTHLASNRQVFSSESSFEGNSAEIVASIEGNREPLLDGGNEIVAKLKLIRTLFPHPKDDLERVQMSGHEEVQAKIRAFEERVGKILAEHIEAIRTLDVDSPNVQVQKGNNLKIAAAKMAFDALERSIDEVIPQRASPGVRPLSIAVLVEMREELRQAFESLKRAAEGGIIERLRAIRALFPLPTSEATEAQIGGHKAVRERIDAFGVRIGQVVKEHQAVIRALNMRDPNPEVQQENQRKIAAARAAIVELEKEAAAAIPALNVRDNVRGTRADTVLLAARRGDLLKNGFKLLKRAMENLIVKVLPAQKVRAFQTRNLPEKISADFCAKNSNMQQQVQMQTQIEMDVQQQTHTLSKVSVSHRPHTPGAIDYDRFLEVAQNPGEYRIWGETGRFTRLDYQHPLGADLAADFFNRSDLKQLYISNRAATLLNTLNYRGHPAVYLLTVRRMVAHRPHYTTCIVSQAEYDEAIKPKLARTRRAGDGNSSVSVVSLTSHATALSGGVFGKNNPGKRAQEEEDRRRETHLNSLQVIDSNHWAGWEEGGAGYQEEEEFSRMMVWTKLYIDICFSPISVNAKTGATETVVKEAQMPETFTQNERRSLAELIRELEGIGLYDTLFEWLDAVNATQISSWLKLMNMPKVIEGMQDKGLYDLYLEYLAKGDVPKFPTWLKEKQARERARIPRIDDGGDGMGLGGLDPAVRPRPVRPDHDEKVWSPQDARGRIRSRGGVPVDVQ